MTQYGVSSSITVQSDLSNPAATPLTDADIRKILTDNVSTGKIKMISGSLNYASIHTASTWYSKNPNNETLCVSGVGCSYHSNITVSYKAKASTLYYAVIPNIVTPVFECARNCGPFPDYNRNQHIVMLHELAEVVTVGGCPP